MGKDIFEAVSTAMDDMKLPWDKLCEVTTDRAPAMTGKRDGMVSMVCRKVYNSEGEVVKKLHCIIHQEAIQLSDVMNVVVKTINLIWVQALTDEQSQRILVFCLSGVNAEYEDVIYHSDVQWLSHSSMLQWFYSSRCEIDRFLKEKDLFMNWVTL